MRESGLFPTEFNYVRSSLYCRISEFGTTQKPDGMAVTAPAPVPGSNTKKFIELKWRPTSTQGDQDMHKVCFSAKDSEK